MPGTEFDEQHLQTVVFAEDRLHGEWFQISDRMREFFERVDARSASSEIRQYFPGWPTSIERLDDADECYRAGKRFTRRQLLHLSSVYY